VAFSHHKQQLLDRLEMSKIRKMGQARRREESKRAEAPELGVESEKTIESVEEEDLL